MLFTLSAYTLIVAQSYLKVAIHDLLTVSIAAGHSTVAIGFEKKRKKTKITKNRSIMVVSDHNRPVFYVTLKRYLGYSF
ncbi:hypothetical protein Back11_41490 [Paenibacillus baekrokdamisoli]|uniref:Uncharacterized protein n=1 Tax=Paenibacillus baekrokdamisoli TaxID=1712516 RepID=A0A3G9JIJ8_9BACL|nr:hypothetical protein Back11_41490 [Paenibacillus baekrokdamisoli]